MSDFQKWLSGPGKKIILAIIVGLAAANHVYPVVDPSVLNSVLIAVGTATGAWSSGAKPSDILTEAHKDRRF